MPASPARRPYSASSHLMKIGQRQPDLADDVGRDQAHPPAVVVDVDAAVQPRGRRAGCLRRSRGRLGVRRRRPRRSGTVDVSPKAWSTRPVVQVDMWPPTIVGVRHEVGEGRRARRMPSGSTTHVVVEQQDVVAARRVERPRTWPREKPPEPPRLACSMSAAGRRARRRPRRSPLRPRPSGALVDDDDLVDRAASTSVSRRGRAAGRRSTSGRLKVVMPMDERCPGRGRRRAADPVGADQLDSSPPATRSNQYQPPSPNGFSGSSNSSGRRRSSVPMLVTRLLVCRSALDR